MTRLIVENNSYIINFLYIIRMKILVILVVVAVLALATDKHPPNRRCVAHI